MRAPESTAPNPTILVVEDEVVVGLFIQQGLIDAGFEVLLYSAAEAALETIKSVSVAAAVLDVGLPGMNGDELARCVRAVRPDLPIILATGYDEKEYAGVVATDEWLRVIGKPFDIPRLLLLLDTIGVHALIPKRPNDVPLAAMPA